MKSLDFPKCWQLGLELSRLTGVRTWQNKDHFWENRSSSTQTSVRARYSKPNCYKHQDSTVTSQIAATHPSRGSQREKPEDSTLGLPGVVLFQGDPCKHSGTHQLIQSSQAMSQCKAACTILVLHLWSPECCSPARWSPAHQDHPHPPAPAAPQSHGSTDLLEGQSETLERI